MAKNIVICCDGTGNEYGEKNSNVVKLYWALSAENKQTAYYHPGVGTMGARNALTAVGKWWTETRGLAFGYGFSDNLADVYSYLMGAYTPDAKVFIFGFSRGAYTARALCGLLHMFGLLTPGNEALIPYAIRLYKSNDPEKFHIAAGFQSTFSSPCSPHFVGLWDTVSSIGWILDPIFVRGGHLPYTATLPNVAVLRHAVSIDERRAFFRQNLIHEPTAKNQDLKQVWFVGAHSDVGGSYPERESGLSKIALRWMLCEAGAAGLSLDPKKVDEVLGERFPYMPPDPMGQLHKSLHGFWWLGEGWPKMCYRAVAGPGQAAPVWKRGITVNLGRTRLIPEGAHIHESVFQRMKAVSDYNPRNLPKQYVAEPENSCELTPRPLHGREVPPPPKRPLHRRPGIVTTFVCGVLAVLSALGILLFALTHGLEVPAIERPKTVAWLAQNWTDDQRRRFYHLAQGSELLPYAWFLALEQPKFAFTDAPLLREDSYLGAFGFIPDGANPQNPDGLPVGFSRDERFVDPHTGQKNVVLGFTCAACHTGELFYGDQAIRIDAGPSLVNLQRL